MNYLIHYPLYYECNLHCTYCISKPHFDNNEIGGPCFTIDQFNNFVNTYIPTDNLIINFFGAEPSTYCNHKLIKNFIDNTLNNKIDLLSNGLFGQEFLDFIVSNNDRFERVGLTFHRKQIEDSPLLIDLFYKNLLLLKQNDVNIYVKELLFADDVKKIEDNKRFCKMHGIPVKIQDFKGFQHGSDFTEATEYTIEQRMMIDYEYVHFGASCDCRYGFKNIIIRGDDCPGDIIACWFDQVVVGNIVHNTYNPDYIITRDIRSKQINVVVTPKIYHCT